MKEQTSSYSETPQMLRGMRPRQPERAVADTAAHIHHVRLMWLAAADKSAKPLARLQPDKATRKEVQAALKRSAATIAVLLQKAPNDSTGEVPDFKPREVAFLGYLIAHDSPHRGQMGMLARPLERAVETKATDGLWEWGTLRRDCGSGAKAESASSK
jgi:uncharacterized damage-inducible protein DinB